MVFSIVSVIPVRPAFLLLIEPEPLLGLAHRACQTDSYTSLCFLFLKERQLIVGKVSQNRSSVQFQMISMWLDKFVCIPPHLPGVYPVLL